MKTLVKVLVIVGVVIGSVMIILGLLDASAKAGFTDAEDTRANVVNMILLLAVMVGALVFALIGTAKRANKALMIIFGILLIPCGVLSILMKSYMPGSFFIVGGLIASVGALFSNEEPE